MMELLGNQLLAYILEESRINMENWELLNKITNRCINKYYNLWKAAGVHESYSNNRKYGNSEFRI